MSDRIVKFKLPFLEKENKILYNMYT